MNNTIHRGSILKKAVKNSGIKISELSRKLDKSRRFVYIMFDNESVPLHIFKKVGEIINFDFSNEILELKETLDLSKSEISFKDKYLKLLEEHNELLKKFYEK
jgi:predicted transcriptional regulator